MTMLGKELYLIQNLKNPFWYIVSTSKSEETLVDNKTIIRDL